MLKLLVLLVDIEIKIGIMSLQHKIYGIALSVNALKILASPEGRLSGDGVAVLRFPECLLDGLLAAAPSHLACPSRGARPPSLS